MPDLTIIYVCCCASNEYWERDVKGSKGNIYTIKFDKGSHKFQEEYEYGYSCTCPAYRYGKGYCKHIKKVKRLHCRWESEVDHVAKCPKCGNDTTVVRRGV